MDCFTTYFTHAQTCDNVRVQSATAWIASVHTLHMPKPVITFVFKVLRPLQKHAPKWKISRGLRLPSLDDGERRPLGVILPGLFLEGSDGEKVFFGGISC